MLRPEYPIETARLTLRPFRVDDLDDLYAYHSLPEVVRYLYWETRDRAGVQAYLEGKVGLTAWRTRATGSCSPSSGGRSAGWSGRSTWSG